MSSCQGIRLLSCLFLALAASFSLLCSTVSVAATAIESIENHRSSIFYSGGAEGWYWYQDPQKEEEETLEPPIPPVAEATPEPKESKPVDQGHPPFSLKWVQEMLPKYKEKAWDDPTPENVQAYFLIQRFAMDKANRFADVAQKVVVGNIFLDESLRRPLTMGFQKYVDYKAQQNAQEVLQKIAQKAGIFFFFKSDCRFCEVQAATIKDFELLGFQILAISVDGGELPNFKFENTRIDEGQAYAMGVTSTPAMFLIDENGTFTPLGQTLIGNNELQERILIVAQRAGWITEEEFRETRQMLNPNDQIDLGVEFPKLIQAAVDPTAILAGGQQQDFDHMKNVADTKKEILGERNFIDPQNLIAMLENGVNRKPVKLTNPAEYILQDDEHSNLVKNLTTKELLQLIQ